MDRRRLLSLSVAIVAALVAIGGSVAIFVQDRTTTDDSSVPSVARGVYVVSATTPLEHRDRR
jgi:hypothetical protein